MIFEKHIQFWQKITWGCNGASSWGWGCFSLGKQAPRDLDEPRRADTSISPCPITDFQGFIIKQVFILTVTQHPLAHHQLPCSPPASWLKCLLWSHGRCASKPLLQEKIEAGKDLQVTGVTHPALPFVPSPTLGKPDMANSPVSSEV